MTHEQKINIMIDGILTAYDLDLIETHEQVIDMIRSVMNSIPVEIPEV